MQVIGVNSGISNGNTQDGITVTQIMNAQRSPRVFFVETDILEYISIGVHPNERIA